MSSRLLKSMSCTNDKALLDEPPIFPEELVWRGALEALSIEAEFAAAFLVTGSVSVVKSKTLKSPLLYRAQPWRQTGIAGVPFSP
jgi:hypothetical protein